MKSLLTALLFTSVTVAAHAADASSVSGTWQIHNNVSGHESDHTCTLVQKDKELTGSCTTNEGSATITGKVDGKKVTWTYKSEYNGGPLTLTYEATVESADSFTGTVNVAEYSVDGEFTATLQK